MIYAIAGTYEQARHEMQSERGHSPSDWRYVSGPEVLAGVHGADVRWCGTAFMRDDYAAIRAAYEMAIR